MGEETLINIFVEESEEILEELEIDLIQLEGNPQDDELINKIFRSMHTLKGSAGLTGLTDIADFVHHAEDVLDKIRNHSLQINYEIISLLLESRDIIEAMVKQIFNPEYHVDQQKVIEISTAFKFFLEAPVSNQGAKDFVEEKQKLSEEDSVYRIKLKLNNNLFETGTDPLGLIKELSDFCDVLDINVNLSRIPEIYELNPEGCYLTLTIFVKTSDSLKRLQDVFIFIEFYNEIEIEEVTEDFKDGLDQTLAEKLTGEILVERGIVEEEDIEEALEEQNRIGEILSKRGKVSKKQVEKVVGEQTKVRNIKEKSSIKVDTYKLEQLMNSMAELVISQAKVRDLVFQFHNNKETEFVTAFDEVDKRIKDLQEEIMKVRMVPIGDTFIRFKRLVRDLSKKQGKEIALEIKGKETELDKNIIEQIADPLKHMIRNSIDHGIELPEEREQEGKNRVGKITLSAYHKEGSIIIKVVDDGAGLDKDKILRKAIDKGIVNREDKLKDEDIYQLIFAPGFSTAQVVTETSGRGVGMDVVRSNIERLRGTVNISTALNQGTTFKIKLPLTLAIIDGMAIKVGEENFIIPMNAIYEFIQPAPEHLKTVKGKGEVVKVRDNYITLTRLHSLFNIEAKETDPTKAIVVVVHDEGKKTCLLVDEILGQQQAVVKSLEDNYTYVEGMAGATILGNGNVAMILDISTIIKMALR
ncbi:two-component system chemotaxis sensor kinase CheA [Orenia metallireducens]|uniref:Chemotaxis protein CheA n=1 Tax=Orenia metallireducens TaxID=1413210 RepID=A0A285HG63_9FIRM|nr:chemotaxis protein CheA [Orenia metallireducens]PRX27473.1 two-component system chemotaxis sensor kinase CheA [Orenia metallireducens]SNY34657.1 two-component system, chemotaxis family, sensor kinase CheA [Orenia metallireducens]